MCAVESINLRSSTYWSRFSSNNFVPSNASVVFSLSDNRALSALTGYTLNLANLYDLLPNTNSGDRGVTVSARLSYSGINVDASFLLTLQGIASFSIPSNTFSNVVNNRQTFCNNSGSQAISTLSNVTWSGSHVSNNRFNTNTASNSSYTLTATRSRTGTGGCVVRRTATTNVSVITPSVNLSSGNVLKYCDYNSDVALGGIVGTPGGGSFSYPRNNANKSLVVSNGLIRISSTGAGTYPIVYTKEINGCVGSARQDMVINPRPAIPSIVNVANHERCGPGSVSLSVSHPESGDGNYIWKSSSGSLIGGFTDNTYQQNYGSTTGRKVIFKKSSTGCESLERSLQARVKPIPIPPTLSQTNSVCGSGVVNLRASHANNNVSFRWYTTSSGVSSLLSASTYNTPTIIPYYVSAVLEGCPSSRAVINASVNYIPGTPDVDNSLNFACSTSDVLTLSVRGALANESYRWYTALTGGVSVSNTSQHTLSYDDDQNVTFYVSKVNDVTGCEGSRVEVTGVWREKREAPILVGGSNCGAGNVPLSASHDGTGILYQWYSSVSNVPVGNPVSLFSTYNPYLTSSKDYVVSVVDDDECVSAFASVRATIYDVPDAPVLVGGAVCGAGNLTMSVEDPVDDYIYKWYSSPNGLDLLNEGISYTALVTQTRTYYVSATTSNGCLSSARSSVVAIVNSIPAVPETNNDENFACSLNENFDELTINVSGAVNNESYRWYTVASGGESIDNITSRHVVTYSGSRLVRFYVSKVNNITGCEGPRILVSGVWKVDMVAPTVVSGNTCGSGVVTLSAVHNGFNLDEYVWVDPVSEEIVLRGAESNEYKPNLSSDKTYNVYVISNDGCESNVVEVTGEVHTIPEIPDVEEVVALCGSGGVTLNILNPVNNFVYVWFDGSDRELFRGLSYEVAGISQTISYFVQTISDKGCESVGKKEVEVVVNPLPAVPTTINADNFACSSDDDLTLTVYGASNNESYNWYNVAVGGYDTKFTSGMGDRFQSYVNNDLVTYYVSKSNNITGCESARIKVDGVWKTKREAPSVVVGSNCGMGDVELSVSDDDAVSFRWYSSVNNRPVGNPLSLLGTYNPSLSSTTNYLVSAVGDDGCESNLASVQATIHPIPNAPSVVGDTLCGEGNANLSVVNPVGGYTYRWYDGIDALTSLRVGTNYAPLVSQTRTYYVSAVNNNSCSSDISFSRTSVKAIVNSIPGFPETDNSKNFACSTNDDLVLKVSGVSSNESYRWYTALTGGVSIASTSQHILSYDNNKNISFYVSKVNDITGCEGRRLRVDGVWRNKRLPPLVDSKSRCGPGNISLSAIHGDDDVSFRWYSSVSNTAVGHPINLSSTYNPFLNTTKDYLVSVIDGDNCESEYDSVRATISFIPSSASVVGDTLCGEGNAELSVIDPISGYTYKWYDASNSSISLSQGVSYHPEVLQTRTYYVSSVTSSNCSSDLSFVRTSVKAIVNSIPALPTTDNLKNFACSQEDNLVLNVFGASNDESYQWYTSLAGGDIIENVNNRYSLEYDENANVSFYVSKINDVTGCESRRLQVDGVWREEWEMPSVIDGENCGVGTVTLSAFHSSSDITQFVWKDKESDNIVSRANTYNPLLSATKIYDVYGVDDDNCESQISEATGEIHAIPNAPIAKGDSVCSSGEVTLEVIDPIDGYTYQWYNSRLINVFVGESYTVPINATSIFFVESVSPEGCTPNRTQVLGVVNSLPSLPFGLGVERCGAGEVVLSASGAFQGSSYRWYTSETGGISINNSNSYTPNLVESTTYYASIVSAEGCEGDRFPIVATVNPNPEVPNVVSSSRCGSGVVELGVSHNDNGILSWYEDPSSSTRINTGMSYVTSSLDETDSYFVEFVDQKGCKSERAEVVATVFSDSSLPVIIGDSVCGQGFVTLSVRNPVENVSYSWYNRDDEVIGTDLTVSMFITNDTDFFLEGENMDGCRSGRARATAVVNIVPDVPILEGGENCGEGVIVLNASGAGVSGSYRWYRASTGGASFYEERIYDYPGSVSANFYVSVLSAEGCEGARSEVVATVNPIPVVPNVFDSSRCGGGIVELRASHDKEGSLVWYETAVSNTEIFEGEAFRTPALNETRSYFVKFVDENGCESSRVEVLATIYTIPNVPVAMTDSICGNGRVTLSVINPIDNFVYSWFNNGRNLLRKDTTLEQNITRTTDYYLSVVSDEGCLSPEGSVTAILNAIPDVPILEDGENCGRGVITLNASGAGVDGSYRWYRTSTGGASFYEERIYDYNAVVSDNFHVSVVSAEGCEGERAKVVATVNPIPVVPNVFDSSRCGTGIVELRASHDKEGSLVWYETAISSTEIFEGEVFITPELNATRSYWVKFVDENGCESSRVEVLATIYIIPDVPVAMTDSICGNGRVTLSVINPIDNFVYSWFDNGRNLLIKDTILEQNITRTSDYYLSVVSDEGCLSPETSVTAIFNEIPDVPILEGGENCGRGVIKLNASGAGVDGSYRWYRAPTGGASFYEERIYDYNAVVSDNFHVSVVSAEGCEGERAKVVATVNPIPVVPNVFDSSRCGTGAVELRASHDKEGSLIWYETSVSSIEIFEGEIFRTSSLNETRSYFVKFVDDNGCESSRVEVVATIYDVPNIPVAMTDSVCGNGLVTLSVINPIDNFVYSWFDNGRNLLRKDTMLDQNITRTTDYYLSVVSDEGCLSPEISVTAIVNEVPDVPIIENGESCGRGTITLSASGAGMGGKYLWYTIPLGGASFYEERIYDYNALGNANFHVSVVSAEGCEGERTEVMATINPIPVVPNVFDSSRCGEGIVELRASHSKVGRLVWYETDVSSTEIFEGESFMTPELNATRSYWVKFVDENGCESDRVEVVATIYTIPDVPVAITDSICGSGLVYLSVNNSIGNFVYSWFDNGRNLLIKNIILEDSITRTTDYYLSVVSDEGCLSPETSVTAVVNEIPDVPIIEDGEFCGRGTITLSASGAGVGSEYRWYGSLLGGNSFYDERIYDYNASVSANFYVSVVSDKGCEGARSEVVATVNPIPVVPNVFDSSRCGTGIIELRASHSKVGRLVWYETDVSSTEIFEGETFMTPELNETRSYFVKFVDENGCESDRVEVLATIYIIPNVPVAVTDSICGNGLVTLSVVNPINNFIYSWFDNGKNLLIKDSTLEQSITRISDYYLSVVSDEGCLSPETFVTAILNEVPDVPILEGGENCGEGIIMLKASGAGVNSEYRWYNDSLGGVSFYNERIYDYNASVSDSLYVSVVSVDGCESERSEVVAIINPVPVIPDVYDSSRCASGVVELRVSHGKVGRLVWYETAVSSTEIFEGEVFITPELNETRSYFVKFADDNGCESSRVEVVATVFSPSSLPGIITDSVCGGGLVSLSVRNPVNNVSYFWYNRDGMEIDNELMLNVSIDRDTDFFLDAESSQGCRSGRARATAIVNEIPDVPIVEDGFRCFDDEAITLTAGGAGAGGTYRFYDQKEDGIRVYDGNPYVYNGLATDSFYVSIVSAEGCESARSEMEAVVDSVVSVPVAVHGERCGKGVVKLSADKIGEGTLVWYETDASEVALYRGDTLVTDTLSVTTDYFVELVTSNNCLSDRIVVTAVIHDVPVIPVVEEVNALCGNGHVVINIENPIPNYTYTWLDGSNQTLSVNGFYETNNIVQTTKFFVNVTSDHGCKSLGNTDVEIVVNEIPDVPTVQNGFRCFDGDSIILTAGGAGAGGTYKFYDQKEDGNLVFDGNPYVYNGLVTDSFYVSIVSAEGCEGARSEMEAVVDSVVSVPVAVHGERCGKGIVKLSADKVGESTLVWYETDASEVALYRGDTLVTDTLSLTTNYFVELVTSNNCLSDRIMVTAVVHDIPNVPVVKEIPALCGQGSVTIEIDNPIPNYRYTWSDGSNQVLDVSRLYRANNIVQTTKFFVHVNSDHNCRSVGNTDVEVVVNEIPDVPTIQNGFRCFDGDSIILTAGGAGAGGTYRFYNQKEDGIRVYDGNPYVYNGLATDSFYVSIVSAEGCESARSEMEAVVDSVVSVPVAVHGERCGKGVVELSADKVGEGTLVWYETDASDVALYRGNTLVTDTLSVTTNYFVELVTSNNCLSDRIMVTAVIHDIPVIPVVKEVSALCGQGNVTIEIDNPIPDFTYTWLDGSNQVLVVDTLYETNNIVQTTKFFVNVTSDHGCKSVGNADVEIVVNEIPDVPTVQDGFRCFDGDSIILTAGGAGAGGTYRFYNKKEDGNLVFDGNPYVYNGLTTDSFYVSIVSAEGCEGARSEMEAVVDSVVSVPVAVHGERCGKGVVKLSADKVGEGTLVWYETDASDVALYRGDTLLTDTLSLTTNYFVELETSNNCFSNKIMVTATVYNIPNVPVIETDSLCGEGVFIASASGNEGMGGQYEWYDKALGGTLQYTGTTFSQRIQNTETYYVSYESSLGCVSDRTKAIINVFEIPSTPTIINGSGCFDDEEGVLLSAGGAGANAVYHWYNSNNDVVSRLDTFRHDSNSTSHYQVSIYSQYECESEKVLASATIYPNPSVPAVVEAMRCGAGVVKLSASHGLSGAFKWYGTEQGSDLLGTESAFFTPSITESKGYWAEFVSINGCASQRALTKAEIIPLEALNIGVDIMLCENGEVLNLLEDVPVSYRNNLGINSFMGNGILENNFYPEIAKTGIHEIKYILRDTIKDENINVCYTNGNRMIEVTNILSNDEDIQFISSISDVSIFCQSQTIDLNDFIDSISNDIPSGTWQVDNSLIQLGILDPSVLSNTGTYKVTYENDNLSSGCKIVKEFDIEILGAPEIPELNEIATEICADDSITFEVLNFTESSTYYWSLDNNLLDSGVSYIHKFGKVSGEIQMQEKNVYGCFSEFNSNTINVDIIEGKIVLDRDSIIVNEGINYSFETEYSKEIGYLWDYSIDEGFRSTLAEGLFIFNKITSFTYDKYYVVNLEANTILGCKYNFTDSVFVGDNNREEVLKNIVFQREEKVIVYPTISSGRFFVKLEGFLEACEVVLYSLSGNELDFFVTSSNDTYVLDLTEFPSGSYVVSVRGNSFFKGFLIIKQ